MCIWGRIKCPLWRGVLYLEGPFSEVSFKNTQFYKTCVCRSVPQPSVPAPTPITAPVMTPLGETPIAGQQSPPMSGATATYRQSSPAPAPAQVI